ncbi:MAG: alkaline phosphatase family protein [Gammaproteobacteria bacterium]
MTTSPMVLPDYRGGSIVNLMSSIIGAFGGQNPPYPPLAKLNDGILHQAENIVLLVVDGLGCDYLQTQGVGTTLLRHLRACITSVFPPTTASAVTAFLSGNAPQQHGLTGWFVYFEEVGRVMAVLPLEPRPSGPRRALGRIDAVAILDPRPVFDRIDARCYIVVPERIAYSPFNSAYRGSATVRPYRSLNQCFHTITDIIRESTGRKYIYAYWPELDHLGHTQGVASRAVSTHFAMLDGAFEKFLHTLAGSQTAVIATADHGMVDCRTEQLLRLDDHRLLADTLALPLCGDRRVAYCYVKPGQDRAFEHYVETTLAPYATLFKSRQLVDQGYFGLGPANLRLRSRVGDYTLVMKGHYGIKDWLPGERREVLIGAHGGVSEAEMRVPLIVWSTFSAP